MSSKVEQEPDAVVRYGQAGADKWVIEETILPRMLGRLNLGP